MTHSYYYFAASLPLLEFEGKFPFSVESFLEDCQRLLSEGDCALMQRVLAEEPADTQTNNTVINAWMQFQHSFRNELAWFRSSKLDKDPLRYVRGLRFAEPQFIEAIHQAAKGKDPLAAQKQLDRFQWGFLEELLVGHHYDIEFLFIYALKLKILERHQVYASEKGAGVFKEFKEIEFAESCILDAGFKAGS